jgi:hypothetical protein
MANAYGMITNEDDFKPVVNQSNSMMSAPLTMQTDPMAAMLIEATHLQTRFHRNEHKKLHNAIVAPVAVPLDHHRKGVSTFHASRKQSHSVPLRKSNSSTTTSELSTTWLVLIGIVIALVALFVWYYKVHMSA